MDRRGKLRVPRMLFGRKPRLPPRRCRTPSLALFLAIGSPAPLMAQAADAPHTPPPASEAEHGPRARSLAALRRFADPDPRTSLLLDLLEDCAPSDCPEPPPALLAEAARSAAAVREPARRVELLVRLARLQYHLDLAEEAAASLEEAQTVVQRMEGPEQRSAFLRVSLAYAAIGRKEESAALLAEAEPAHSESPTRRTAPFPFTPAPTQLELGLALSGASYLDTTALASVNLDLYRQAARRDLDVDLMVSADYDSSRDTNNVRPHSQVVLVYRHHLNRRWNLFFDQLVSVNTDTFASDNNDEDLSVLSASLVGAGLNLWRGRNPGSFVELQLGVGARYEYELIDFQLRRNQVDPSLGMVFRSRELPIGKGRLNQTLALANSMRDWSNFFVWSSTRLKFPLSERWWWNNELVLRYRSEPTATSYPKVNTQFSTGLNYSF